MEYPEYSVVIRTLGTSGEKYMQELRSIAQQTILPTGIFVYIPYGYDLPKETIHKECYIRCEKGMVTQRSFRFEEVTSEYILFLDDDMWLPNDAVQKMFDALRVYNADCVSSNVFANHTASLGHKFINALSGIYPHFDQAWAFKIRPSSYYSYNNSPKQFILPSQSASFNAFLIKKKVYEAIHYEDERWMDEFQYALGDDQLFFYKLYKYGYKVLVHYNTGIIHLDAGTGRNRNKIVADYNTRLLRYVLWYRSIYETQESSIKRIISQISYCIEFGRSFLFVIFLGFKVRHIYPVLNLFKATIAGYRYCKTEHYRTIPKYMNWFK